TNASRQPSAAEVPPQANEQSQRTSSEPCARQNCGLSIGASSTVGVSRRSKFEIRNSKSQTPPKSKARNVPVPPCFVPHVLNICASKLFRISDFESRIFGLDFVLRI